MLGVWSKRANVWTKSRFPSLKIIIETTTFTKSLIVLPSTNDIRSKKCFEKIMFLKKNSRSAGGRVYSDGICSVHIPEIQRQIIIETKM